MNLFGKFALEFAPLRLWTLERWFPVFPNMLCRDRMELKGEKQFYLSSTIEVGALEGHRVRDGHLNTLNGPLFGL